MSKIMLSNWTRVQWMTLAAFVVSSAMATPAAAKNWADGTGFWNVPGNWSPAAVPVAGEAVNIVFTDGTARTITYDAPSTPTLGAVSIDLTGAGTAASTLSLTNSGSNNLSTNGGFIVGGYNGTAVTAGRGAVIQSVGTATVQPGVDMTLGHGAGSTGTYTLSGGALVANQSEYMGLSGTGTFNQSAGTNTINSSSVGAFDLGIFSTATGNYNLSVTGALSVTAHEYIGDQGHGTFTQTGGTNTISGASHNLYLGYAASGVGTYTISGNSTLAVGNNLIVGQSGTGTMNISGSASVYVQNDIVANSTGNINLNGGTLRFNTVNYVGSAGLHFNSGTVRLAGTRTIGADSTISQLADPINGLPAGKTLVIEGGAGTVGTIVNDSDVLGFRLLGGTLTSVKDMQVGLDAFSYLNIANGSTVVSPHTQIGVDTGSGAANGIVNVFGSTWNNAGDIEVGSATAMGSLGVLDGSLVDTGGLIINQKGTVVLLGGTIRFDTYARSSTGTFNFDHGTVEMRGDRTIGSGFPIPDLFGSQAILTANKNFTIDGVTQIQSSLTIAGGTFKTSSLIVQSGGLLNFQSGVLELTSGGIAGLAQLNVPTSGEFRANGSQSFRVVGAAGSTITATGNLTLGNATAVNGFGTQGTLAVGANTVTLLDANDVVFDSLSLVTLGNGATTGTVSAANGLTLDFGGNITGYGTVSTPNLLAKPLIANGHISGTSAAQKITLSGYVKGAGTFDNVTFSGTFSPGLSPTISSVGSISLGSSNTLIMELGGTTPGNSYDQIHASGTLGLGGILQISLINGFVPVAGQSFDILDWGSISGAFSSINLPTLSGLTWNTSLLYSTGAISVAAVGLPGDYNSNGTVDATDYVLWRKYQGTTHVLPNDPIGGTIGAAQFDQWRAHFGQPPGSGAGSIANTAVPEPTTLVLLMFAAAGSCLRRGRSV